MGIYLLPNYFLTVHVLNGTQVTLFLDFKNVNKRKTKANKNCDSNSKMYNFPF